MSDSMDDVQRRQTLSDLMDGAADDSAVARACAAWRDDARARSEWHAYQLIGDVLRSDDLAQTPSRDLAFLAGVRARLAGEAVVLAPVPVPVSASVLVPVQTNPAASPARRRGWMAPVAVAAGFVAVAGVLVVTRVDGPVDNGATPMLAAAPAPAPARSVPPAVQPVTALEPMLADGKLLRDVRLDRYLAAHKQYGTSSALAVPGVVLRSATTAAPDR